MLCLVLAFEYDGPTIPGMVVHNGENVVVSLSGGMDGSDEIHVDVVKGCRDA